MFATSISNAFNTVITQLITFIPELVAALLLIILGIIVALIVKTAVNKILGLIQFDKLTDKVGINKFLESVGITLDPAGILAWFAYWFILLIFIIAAANAMHLTVITQLLNQIYLYIPKAFAATLIILFGFAGANILADIVQGAAVVTHTGLQSFFTGLIKWSIILFAILAALEQLDIAPDLVNILFTGVVLAIAIGTGLAIGLAFGLGGRDAATQVVIRMLRTQTPPTRQERGERK